MNFDSMLGAINEHMKNAPNSNLSPEASKWTNLLNELHVDMVGDTKLQFTIYGEFNAGKSTLLNALLGAEVSPTSILPATAINLYVEYAETPSATMVKRKPDGQLAEEAVDVRDLSNQAKLQFSSSGMSAPTGVEAIKIKWPIAVLQNKGMIVDTPGLADTQERSQIAHAEMSKTDIVLCVLRFEQLLNEHEMSFLQELTKHVNGNVVFIINVKDAPPHSQIAEAIQYVRTMLKQIQSQLWEGVVIFPINACLAFKERLAGKTSGEGSLALRELESWMGNVLNPDFSTRIRLTSRLKRFQQYLAQLEQTLKQDIEQQNKYIKEVEGELREEHREAVKSFQSEMREVIDRLEEAKREDIGEFIDKFVKEYRKVAEEEIRSNVDWYDPIREALRSAYRSFRSEFIEHLEDIIRARSYDLYQEIDLSDFSITWRWTAATYFQGNLGEKISIFFSDETEDDFAVKRVKEDAKSRRHDLRKQVEKLIDTVIEEINDYRRKNRPNIRNYLDSGRLEDAKEQLRHYTQNVGWCTSFSTKLK